MRGNRFTTETAFMGVRRESRAFATQGKTNTHIHLVAMSAVKGAPRVLRSHQVPHASQHRTIDQGLRE
jgi:hypothetical protein